MPAHHRWLAAIACLLVAGCTALHPRVDRATKRLDCDGSSACTVVVTVDCLRYVACDAWVDHAVVLALARDRPMDVRWRLEGDPGAEFAPNGIVADSAVFDCTADGRSAFACRDRHPDFGVFKYTINITVKNSAFGPRGVPSLDAWIVNN